MNKTDLKNMSIGVIIGTFGTLLLTLQFWGDEWYKVVASIALGIILGMFIADYKLTIQIFKNSFLQSFGRLGSYLWRESPIFLANGCLAIIFFIIPGAIAMLSFPFALEIMDNPFLLIVIAGSSLYWLNTGMNSLEYKTWTKLSAERKIRLWGEDGELVTKTFRQGSDYQVSLDNDYYKKRIGERRVAKAMLYSSFISFNNRFWAGIKSAPRSFVKVASFFLRALVTVVIFIGTLSVTFPFWFIKEVGKSGKMLSISLGVLTGGIVGTLSNSYFFGIGSGLCIMISIYLLSKIERVDVIYFCRDGRLLDRLWS